MQTTTLDFPTLAEYRTHVKKNLLSHFNNRLDFVDSLLDRENSLVNQMYATEHNSGTCADVILETYYFGNE